MSKPSHTDAAMVSRLVVADSLSAPASTAVGLDGVRNRLRRWWKEQTAPRIEDEMLDGDGSTITRLVLPVLLPVLFVPAILLVREPTNEFAALVLGFGAIAIAYALGAEWVERRWGATFWLHLANGGVYALLITALVWASIVYEHPREHTHWILFFLYFLLIGATGMSDDPRQPLCAGGLSIIGYVAILPLVRRAAAEGAPMAQLLAPEFEWVANSAKIAVLAGSTLVAVSSAARGRAVRRLSLRDGLTGLLNRHAFDRCLRQLAHSASRRSHPVTVAMVDIDHFKRLNDEFGHGTGDAVLRWVAGSLQQSFRATDVVARYGGEEFVIAFPDTGDPAMVDRLDALRERIAETPLRDRREADELAPAAAAEVHVSVSIGTARLPVDSDDLEGTLALADERLYRAKAQGRNRIVSS